MGDFEDLTALESFFNKNSSSAHNENREEYEEFHYLSCAGFSYNYNNDEEESDDEFDEECESVSEIEVANTEEEKAIIDDCNDEELKELLRLNRQKNAYLLTIYKSCKDALTQCQADIAGILSSNAKKKDKAHNAEYKFPKIWMTGKPYFKTEDFYPCPPNQDTLIKFKNNELNLCDLLLPAAVKWSKLDAVRLLKWVNYQAKTKKKAEILTEIEKTGESKELKLQLSKLLDTNYIIPYLNSDSIDWTRVGLLFEQKYTSDECRIYWNISVNPNINQAVWLDEEVENLKSLAVKHNFQNWDLIAKELGTGRTGYTVFLSYYSSKIARPFQCGRFFPDEDKKLVDLVEKYKTGNLIKWTAVSRNFPNRTKSQLFFRYKYYLNCKSTISKERFLEAEDALILVLVNRFGKKFTKCAEFMPNRSANQIKSRYSNISNAGLNLNKEPFTPTEDIEIVDYVLKNGTNNWKTLATKLMRASNQIQQRYQTLNRFLETNPDSDIRNAPRKHSRKADIEDRYQYIKYVAQKFSNSNKIPTLEEIANAMQENPQETVSSSSSGLGVKRKVPDTGSGNEKNSGFNIDDLIVDFFSTQRTAESILQDNRFNKQISTVAIAVFNVLNTLNAHLLIPTNNSIAENEHLDEIDRKLLKLLTQNRFVTLNAEFEIKCINSKFPIMPSNLNTLIGMRNILIRHEVFKKNCGQISKNKSQFCKSDLEERVSWSLETHLALQPVETREKLLKERDLFTKRFFLLFKIPAMMSLIKPSVILVPDNSTVPEKKETKSVRTYQRKPKIQKIVDNTQLVVKGE